MLNNSLYDGQGYWNCHFRKSLRLFFILEEYPFGEKLHYLIMRTCYEMVRANIPSSHVVPVQPDLQSQRNELNSSTHTPSFWQGPDSHSSVSNKQKVFFKRVKKWRKKIRQRLLFNSRIWVHYALKDMIMKMIMGSCIALMSVKLDTPGASLIDGRFR